MIPFELTILGAGSAIPTVQRNASSQLLQYNGITILIDCAEGTQLLLKRHKISAMRIDHVLISHLHGDHYFGLIGLINTLHFIGRTLPLNLFGPPQLINILQLMLDASDTQLRFELHFHPLEENSFHQIFEDKHLTISSFPVEHRIPTWGFLIREKQVYKQIDPKFIRGYNPGFAQMLSIKQGADFVDHQGNSMSNESITLPLNQARAYAYCTDTAFTESIVPYIKGASLLYHEATFMENLVDKASLTYHSTSKQAATIAKMAEVGKLILGHFSSRYGDLQPLLKEAKAVFENVDLAIDGKKIVIL